MIPPIAAEAGFSDEEWAHVLGLVADHALRDVISVEDLLCAALPGLIGPLTINAFHKGMIAGREEHLSELEECIAQLRSLRASELTSS